MNRHHLIRVAAAVASGHSGGGPAPGSGLTRPPDHGPGPGRGPGPELAAAATYLGVSGDALRSELQSGETLAQIADATSGKSASGLVVTLLAADKTRITALVNGQLPPHP